jgi:hypothetical protein
MVHVMMLCKLKKLDIFCKFYEITPTMVHVMMFCANQQVRHVLQALIKLGSWVHKELKSSYYH